jgi:type I site-specific restriction endonuclease
MSKKDLSEADICDRYITPALYEAGWNLSYASILHRHCCRLSWDHDQKI